MYLNEINFKLGTKVDQVILGIFAQHIFNTGNALASNIHTDLKHKMQDAFNRHQILSMSGSVIQDGAKTVSSCLSHRSNDVRADIEIDFYEYHDFIANRSETN